MLPIPAHVAYTGDAVLASRYLPEAKALLASLPSGTFHCAKKYRDGTIIKVTRLGSINKILIITAISELRDHILLTDYTTSWAYNYYKYQLTGVPTPVDASPAPLTPLFNGRSQLAELDFFLYSDTWEVGHVNGGGAYEYIGGVNRYELGVFSDSDHLYGRVGDVGFLLGSLLNIPALSYTDKSFVNLASYDIADYEWALLAPILIRTLPLHSKVAYETYRWTPSFYFAEEGNETQKTGWFYGKKGVWGEGDTFEALIPDPEDGICGRAELLAFMEGRGANPTTAKFGYCEALTQLTYHTQPEEDPLAPALPILSFFVFDTPSNDDGRMWFNWRSTTLLTQASMRGGTSPDGTAYRLFSIRDPFGGVLPDAVHMWEFDAWYDQTELSNPQTPDCVGVVISQGQDAEVYRAKVYTPTTGTPYASAELVLSLEDYHSHSLTPDGSTLAVFTGTPSLITGVKVFDLFGVKVTVSEDLTVAERTNESYVSGGYTLIDDGDLTTATAVTGCLIPYRAEATEVDPFPGSMEDGDIISSAASGRFSPAMGSLHWQRDGRAGLTINKLTIEEGTKAAVGQSSDPCFDSTIVIDNPGDPTTDGDMFVMSWGDGSSPLSLYSGRIRGLFSGAHPNMRFAGVGAGSIETVTLPDSFGLWQTETAPFWYAEGYTGGLTTQGKYENAPGADCEDQIDWEWLVATSGCGQRETLVDVIPPFITPPSITTPVNNAGVGVGTLIEITSGRQPYTSVTFTMGGVAQLDEDTWQITSVDACVAPLDPRWGVIEVTDSCGRVDSVGVRVLTGGKYCCVVNNDCDPTHIIGSCPSIDSVPLPPDCWQNVPFNYYTYANYSLGGFLYRAMFYGGYGSGCSACSDVDPNGYTPEFPSSSYTDCYGFLLAAEWVCS